MKRFASSFERVFNTVIVVGNKRYNCWVAANDTCLRVGLMGHQLQPKHGCLLDFGQDSDFGLWMKDCLHPLTAVFMDSDGIVIGKANMSHEDPYYSHRPPQPCRFALELLPEDADGINIGDQAYEWGPDE